MSASEEHFEKCARVSPVIEAGAPHAAPEVVFLGRDHIEEVCRLESRSYPSPWSAHLVRGEFEKSVSLRLGLKLGEQLVAYSFNYVVVDELHILNVAVHPDFRNMGLGERLMRDCIAHSAGNGMKYAILEVRVSNTRARNLYEKMGFKTIHTRRKYYSDTGEDAYVMMFEIKQT